MKAKKQIKYSKNSKILEQNGSNTKKIKNMKNTRNQNPAT
jgi:hypothetical protein